MIQSYRSKRRKIQEELEFLNNRPTILQSSKTSNISVLDTNCEFIKNTSVPSSTLTKSNVLDSDKNCIQDFQEHQQKNNTLIENPRENPIVNQCVDSIYNLTNNYGSTPLTNNCANETEILKLNLANWAIERNVAQNTVNDLLSILKQHRFFAEIPLDCRTLLEPSSSKTKNI